MNVFRYEISQNKKHILEWSAIYIIFTAAALSAMPLFTDESVGLKEMLYSLPPFILDAMGFNLDPEVYFSAVGLYSFIFLYIGLIASIQAMGLGLGVISKEIRMKTADFLMTKPVSRSRIHIQKWAASFISLLISQAVFFTAALISVYIQSGGDFAFKPFILISATFFFIQMMYLSLGLLLAVLIKKVKSALTLTMGFCFGTFLAGMVSSVTGSKTLRYLSPLHYFDNNKIMFANAYETKYLVITAVICVFCTLAGFIIYIKRDIASAA